MHRPGRQSSKIVASTDLIPELRQRLLKGFGLYFSWIAQVKFVDWLPFKLHFSDFFPSIICAAVHRYLHAQDMCPAESFSDYHGSVACMLLCRLSTCSWT